MKTCPKILSLVLAVLLVAACCTGCGKSTPYTIFNFVVWGPYVDENYVKPQIESYLKEIPELSTLETEVATISTGTSDRIDSSEYTVHSMQLNAMVAYGEVDIVIMERESAARAARGGLFIPLSEIFSEEELAAFGDRLLDFEELDPTGKPLGTRTAICGIDMSGSEFTANFLGPEEYGIYAVSDMEPAGMTKAVMTYFAGLE